MSVKDLVPATTTAASVPARLAPISGADEYPVLTMSPEKFLETMLENTGSTKFSYSMVERIKYPSTDTVFVVTDDLINEEREYTELDAIILAVVPHRTLWGAKYEPGNTEPPICKSPDGVMGFGDYGYNAGNPENPSGTCATCPMAKFGSADNGKGQACQLKYDIYFLLPGNTMPSLMTLPVTSGTPLTKYRTALTKRSLPIFGVVTTIKATKEDRKAVYSKASFGLKHVLPEHEVEALRAYAAGVREQLIAARGTSEDGGETLEGVVDGEKAAAVPAEELPF
ncbi:MAG: hypothetical protein ACXWQ5_00850 [Ktedonobacterales bacterium]